MKILQAISLAVLSGVLLWLSWPVSPFTWLIFVALVPLLRLEEMVTSGWKFFCYTYCTLLIWNAATTWWIINSTVPGGIAAIIANSLFMCIPWIGFHAVKKRAGATQGYISLALFWLTFEYIHLNWELSWPWLTLGNVFAQHPEWIQWYEYTGTSGGSLWIVSINILMYILLRNRTYKNSYSIQYILSTVLVLLIPFIISFLLRPQGRTPATGKHNIVVVQPDIDPYKKFAAGSEAEQLHQLIRLSEAAIDTNTALVVWPETAINHSTGIDETKLHHLAFLTPVWSFLKQHPQLKLFSGIEGYRLFSDHSGTGLDGNTSWYHESYNTAALLDSTGALQMYHKSKFVPGVETLPSWLGFLGSWFEQFGGTSGGYVGQQERTVITDPQSGYNIAPAICYESIYGEFLTGYMRNGANVITIITNDGWWANTSGYKQHMQYARLRAVESRRWVVHSANTGISCFISPAGGVYQQEPWDKAAVIKMAVPVSNYLTFYTKYGDIISKIAAGLTVLLIINGIAVWWKRSILKKTVE